MKLSLQILSLTAISLFNAANAAQASEVTPSDVIDTYANIAQAGYQDALSTAQALRTSIRTLINKPSEDSLENARSAWKAARIPYQQTEVYRFGNAVVDDWEGKVNAWPLDEGLIDYVDSSYGADSEENGFYTANIIANPSVSINGQVIDASTITPELLSSELHEAGGIESNVATGYHAIEFLLWGQDLNGSHAGSGSRPYTDYDINNCTNAHCDRRAEYLSAVTDLLITDLKTMAGAWSSGGQARTALLGKGDEAGLATILTGMGSLSYGELAGERMQLGLMLHDPEEEHDCFADNTSASHFYDGVGIQNVYAGRYERVNGDIVSGPSVKDLLAATDASLSTELGSDLQASVDALQVLLDSQHAGQAYDQLIAEGNTAGNELVQTAIDALIYQTRNIERAVVALGVSGIQFEGSDSLDDPSSVFQ
ncbi:MAG: imelysin family protein [Granulosicoccus sp.]